MSHLLACCQVNLSMLTRPLCSEAFCWAYSSDATHSTSTTHAIDAHSIVCYSYNTYGSGRWKINSLHCFNVPSDSTVQFFENVFDLIWLDSHRWINFSVSLIQWQALRMSCKFLEDDNDKNRMYNNWRSSSLHMSHSWYLWWKTMFYNVLMHIQSVTVTVMLVCTSL